MSEYDDVPDFERENDFAAMTRYEVADALAENGLVLIPTGSIEQHGHHLPVGTDTFAVRSVAKRMAGKLGGLLVPFAPMGVTPLHEGMAGALSLEPETYMALFDDVFENLINHGADQIVVVNWHEVNASSIETVMTRAQKRHPDVRFVIAQAHFTARDLYEDYHDLTHGGPLEVLPVLGDHEDLVHLDRATDASDEGRASEMDDLRRSDSAYPIIPDTRIMYPSGWYGDLSEVAEYDGEAFLDRVAEACAADVAAALDALEDVDFEDDFGTEES